MKHAPQKAFILAAGYGSRMEPLTRETPKPLMPFNGKPMLQHTLEMLQSWGVEEILVNCHHRAECIVSWLVGFDAPGLKINISYEPDILGTGGALAHAAWWIDERPFWMINADVIADLDPTPLLKAYRRKEQPLAALWMHGERGPRTVEVKKGRVTHFHVAAPGAPGTATFCGLQLLDQRILNYLPKTGFSSIIRGYLNAMEKGHFCAGVSVSPSYWADVGTPEQYLDAHAEVPPRKQFKVISPGAVVSPKAQIQNSVIWDGARVTARARLNRAIIGPGATAYGETQGVLVRASTVLQSEEEALIAKLNWNVDLTSAQILPARGSDRAYIRLHSNANRKGILIRYGTERAENESYVTHTSFLKKQGVRVPEILADDPRHRITLMEDLGNTHLLDLAQTRRPSAVRTAYQQSLAEVARFHACGKKVGKLSLQAPFSDRLYQWERELFINEFLKGACELDARRIRPAMKELEKAATCLTRVTPVLVHRDLQSTNIMWVKNQPVLIDYQGMRCGAAAYDLASFLADPYVMLPLTLQLELLDDYVALSGDTEARDTFWPAGLQRLAQALGAYGRLGRQPATRRFLAHIPPALEMMIRCTEQVEGFEHLRNLLMDISRDVWPSV